MNIFICTFILSAAILSSFQVILVTVHDDEEVSG